MDNAKIKTNILVVVCHPDDEALWLGGTLCALTGFDSVEVSVICLSGADDQSPRQEEFFRAKSVAGYARGIVLGGKLRAALDHLPDTTATLEHGLNIFGMTPDQIDLLLTHPPYGDEHLHPHHMQASEELAKWTSEHRVPFGFFSCLPMPWGDLRPFSKNLKRRGHFHLLQLAKCQYSLLYWPLRYLARKSYLFPKYYLQFSTNIDAKQAMLDCYESIDLHATRNSYAMFSNNCEAIYVHSPRGMKPFKLVMQEMDVPGAKDTFPPLWWIGIGWRKAISKFLNQTVWTCRLRK